MCSYIWPCGAPPPKTFLNSKPSYAWPVPKFPACPPPVGGGPVSRLITTVSAPSGPRMIRLALCPPLYSWRDGVTNPVACLRLGTVVGLVVLLAADDRAAAVQMPYAQPRPACTAAQGHGERLGGTAGGRIPLERATRHNIAPDGPQGWLLDLLGSLTSDAVGPAEAANGRRCGLRRGWQRSLSNEQAVRATH